MKNTLLTLILSLLMAVAAWAQPAVNGSTPSRNAVNIAASANINISFSQAMDEASLNATTVKVVGSYRGAYTGVFSMSNASNMVFNPDVDFLPGEVIAVTVTTEAKNSSDVAMTRAYSFSFTAAATGFGLFEQPVTFTGVPGENATDVVAADLNGDGNIDLAVLSQGANAVYVHFSNGDGTFATPVVLANRSGAIAMKLIAADVNGNGRPDLLVANISAYSLAVFLNNGDNTFIEREDYATSASLGASDMVVMDITGDGTLDVVQLHHGTPSASQFLFHYSNDGSGALGTGSQITIADLSGGGSLAVSYHNATTMSSNSLYQWRPHLLVTDYTNNQLRVYENIGSGTGYSYSQTRFAGTNPVAVGGFRLYTNSPGADAVVLNSGSNNMTVYRAPEVWSGDSFGSQSNFSTGNSPTAVAGGDLNGNGSIDLIVVNGGDGTLSYLPNTTGTFFDNNSLSVGANATQAVLADMNGNGRLDVVTANTNGSVSILYNYPGPEITSVTPANNATSVSSYADIVIEFSVDFMDPTTMNASTIQVLDADEEVIASTFNFDGSTLTITPDAPFQQNTSVTVTVTADVKTTTNLAIINPTTFSFQVAESFASIVSVSPAANALHGPYESLSIEFADDMKLTSIENGVQVIGSARGAYGGVWGFNSGTNIATFTPTLDLVSGEAISVIVGTSVETSIGGFLEEQFQWSFMIDAAGGGGFLQSDAIGTDIPSNSVVKVADMNGDGIVDIVAMGYDYLVLNKSVVSVSLNDGFGGYEAPVITDLGTDRAANITVADFDNDGNADIAVVHTSGANMVSFHFGNGLGGFGAPVTYTVTEQYLDFLAAGDLNGDGLLDLAVTRYSSSDVVVLRNNGNRTFTPQSPISSGGGAWGIQIADVNNDGHLDVVTADYDDETISVLMNNGNGTFASKVSYAAGEYVASMAAGDVNGNGFIDIVADDYGSNFFVMLNDGNGVFTLGSTIQADGYKPSLVKTTGDGNLDLVAINSGNLIVFKSNGDGTFNSSPKLISVPGWAQSFSSLDMDGDNEVDLVALSDDGNAYIMLNVVPVTVVSTTPTSNELNISDASTITATFSVDMDAATVTATNMPVFSQRQGLLSAQYTYDGVTRTVTISPDSPFLPGDKISVSVSKGLKSPDNVPLESAYASEFTVAASGNGYFSFEDVLSTGSVYNSSLYAADVDGDGDDDLIGFTNGAVKVYKNNAGVFSEFSSLTVTGWPERGIVGDFNNDGHVDIAYRRPNSASNIQFLQNDGLGNFSVGPTAYMESSTRDAITADFDGDGNLDIAFIVGSQVMSLYWGNGDFTFPGQNGFVTGTGGGGAFTLSKLSSGDINNNGLIDIVGYEDQNGTIVVMRNNGSRSFSFTTTYATPARASDIALFDLSGDSYLDIVVSSSDGKSFSVLKNNGDGTFQTAVTYGVPFELKRVTPFDLSGNGAIDLVFYADSDDGELLFMAYNDGNGGFGNQVSFRIPEEEPEWYYGLSQGYAVLDANNDGALDIASRLTNGPTQFIAFIHNAAPTGGGSAPTQAVTSASASSIKDKSARLSWTSGDGLRRLIVLKEGSAVDANMVDDFGYSPNPIFGQGTQVGAGNYLVYGGNGSSTTISGLSAETTYHYAIYEINGVPGQEKVLTTNPAIGSFTTAGPPPIWNVNDQSVTFAKTNYAEWSHEASQDRIVPGVWFARKNSQGLFNAAQESGWDSDVSPKGTLWAQGTTANLETLTFDTFYNTLDQSIGDNIEDLDMVVFLEDQNIYLDINFDSWTSSSNGGGFSYTRGDGDKPEIASDNEAGYAVQYDGSSYSEMEWPYMPAEHTIEMWVKPEVTGTDQVFLVYGNDRILLGIDAANNFYASHYNNGSPVTITGTSISAEVDKWHHVALSAMNGGQLVLYVNSTSVGSSAIANTYLSSNTWYPGTNWNEDKMFTGQIDEFRIWGKVRTESEIRSTMYSEVSGAAVDLMGYWQFNEGSGTTASDVLGFNALTLGSATWVASTTPFGTPAEVATGIQSGTANVGGATLTFNTPFESPVDVFFNEITTEPNVFPTGFTASLGGKYFVIDLVGDPGVFSVDLTLTFGAGVITEANEATPSLLKLFRRSSGSTGDWTEIAGATSAVASTGVVTWSGITSFSEFMATEAELSIFNGSEANITVRERSVLVEVPASAFPITSEMANATFTITSNVEFTGTLFVDENENGVYDELTDLLVNDVTGVSYTPSGTKNLMYVTESFGLESATLTFVNESLTENVTLTAVSIEGTAELAGVANENSWQLVSSPLNTSLGNMFANIWTQGAVNSNAPEGNATLYTFNQDTGAYEAITGDLDATTLASGTGILAYVYAFDDYEVGIPVGGGWPKQLSPTGNAFFTDNFGIPVKNVDLDDNNVTSGSEGYVLLGNPFAWPLDVASVVTKLKALDPNANSYVYRWDPVGGNYQLVTSGAIRPYESVFVRLVSSGITETLNLTTDDQYNQAPKQVTDDMFAFTLGHAASGLESASHLRFDSTATTGIDPFDGYYLGTYASTYANLYTRVDDQALVINNLPTEMFVDEDFPIYLHTSVSGDFTLNWDATKLPKGWDFILTETATGRQVNLRDQASFAFTSGQNMKIATTSAALSVGGAQADIQSGVAGEYDTPIESDHTPSLDGSETSNAVKGDSRAVETSAAADQPMFTLRVRSNAVGTDIAVVEIPNQVELLQNYPNPFNPVTQIRYGVPVQSNVTLEVYDILGRRVAQLLNNDIKEAGRYTVSFDGRNLASGVYIYRLLVGDKQITKSMVLIK